MFKKGRAGFWKYEQGIFGEVRIINNGFVAQIKCMLYFPLPQDMGLAGANRNWFTNLKHFV